ncbi:MAG: hypothetical protein ACI8W8_001853 [Rhodothermales bacterium]|jgi:hypothetical protein
MARLFHRFCRTVVACLLITGGSRLYFDDQMAGLEISDPRGEFEEKLARQQVGLVRISHDLHGRASLRLRFDCDTVRTHQLYLRSPQDPGDYLLVNDAGTLVRAGLTLPQSWSEGELVLSRDRLTLFLDGHPFPANLANWDAFWVSGDDQAPELEITENAIFNISDSFMRKDLGESLWQVHSGSWEIRTFGGGAPSSNADVQNISFQRAVNAFALTGKGGILSYGDAARPHCHAEARFFFGDSANKVESLGSLPTSDMQVVLGDPDGHHVAFGWVAEAAAFQLRSRVGDDLWQVIGSVPEQRPAVSNWVKIGLELENAHIVRALLDDAVVAKGRLRQQIDGSFHLAAGAAPVLIDDVRAWSLPSEPYAGPPIFVKSRNFAGKAEKPNSDPAQFGQWARSNDSFIYATLDDRKTIMNRLPLFGDFAYESVPEDAAAGALPNGDYVFELLAHSAESATLTLAVSRSEAGWTAELPDWPGEHYEFAFRIRRAGDQVSLRVNDEWLALGILAGSCQLRIGRIGESDEPRAEHHRITSANLVNEFFEQAPTDWAWIDGRFRMDIRWACQNQWNFMACNSLDVPYMSSKHRYIGDQIHECYLSLRPLIPRPDGWYVRRDITFSFCTDGRNPLSGYSVVLGADNNRETRLMRKGEVVATCDTKVPGGVAIENVHWMWWNFEAHKEGNQIRIVLNDKTILEYEDPQVLSGGHVGFWSVRNGFTASRYTGMAEEIGYRPDVLYVPNSAPSIWKPLLPDALHLQADDSEWHTRVQPNVGAGSHAVRHTLDPPLALDSAATLDLPLRLSAAARLNVFAEIAGITYVIPVAAPLSDMRSLLGADGGKTYHSPYLSDEQVAARTLSVFTHQNDHLQVNLRQSLSELGVNPAGLTLSAVTIGNCSNADYLLVGARGNDTRASYALGTPQLINLPVLGWEVVDWAAPADIQQEDKSRVRVHSDPVPDIDKTAIGMEYHGDLSAAERAVIHFENRDASSVSVALAVKTTDEHLYYELPPQILEPGSQADLAFSLKSAEWKSEASAWEHNSSLAHAEQTRELFLLIYHQGKGCTLGVDGLVIQ